MADYKIISNGSNIQSSVCEIILDAEAKIQNVPTTFGVGSDVICLDTSSVYMLGNDLQWHKL